MKLLSTGEIISVRTVVKVLGTLVQTRTLSLARQVVIGSLNVFFFHIVSNKKRSPVDLLYQCGARNLTEQIPQSAGK